MLHGRVDKAAHFWFKDSQGVEFELRVRQGRKDDKTGKMAATGNLVDIERLLVNIVKHTAGLRNTADDLR